ncbi:MAG: cache domain-containing protein, partial [Longimicrobiales bacterium]|nr:cache domain-containing protein [Longimicrobiales bacterium]
MGVLRLESIRAKILLLALLATLVPAISTAALSYVRARSALTETLEGELRGIGAQSARELDLWLKERLYDLRVFVGSFEVIENLDRLQQGPDGAAAARLSNYLTVLQERFPEYAGLVVLGRNGASVAQGQDAAAHPDLPPGWLAELEAGEAKVGDPYWHEGLERVATTLAVPIQDADARALGALVATLTFQGLEDLLQGLAPGSQGDIAVLSAD